MRPAKLRETKFETADFSENDRLTNRLSGSNINALTVNALTF